MTNQTPPPPPAISPLDAQKDHSNLKTLSICHYVHAGLLMLGGLFMIAYAFFFSYLMNSPELSAEMAKGLEGAEGMPVNPANLFNLFIIIYGAMGFGAIVLSIMNIISGLALGKRSKRTFTYVTAGLNCLAIPLGTILGIFTIIILGRPSVQALYKEAKGEAAS